MMLAPINTADRVYTIDPSATAVGALAANYWTGFDSPAQQIYSIAGVKNVGASSAGTWGDTAFVTKASGRDQEVSFKVAQTYAGMIVYLRYDGESAVKLVVSKGGNTFKADYVRRTTRILQNYGVGTETLVESRLGVDPGGAVLSTLLGTSTFSVNDVWTFGASGDTFYAKFNGVEFWSARFWTQAKPGKIAVLQEANDDRGYRDVTCTFKPSAVSYSDFDNWVLDLRDWGLKDSATTGSMTAGSYDLVVASAANFSVGDVIVVETGGEAGGGLFGTEGVGGTWPTYSYANQAALPNATTYRAIDNPSDTDLFVWLRDTGKVWINYKNAGVPTWGEFSPATQDYYYYHNEVQPRALVATITNKSGNTLTLDKAAVVSTTNANVYVDCTPAWEEISNGNAVIGTVAPVFGAVHPDWYSVREHVTFRLPPGKFAMRKFHTMPTTRYWTIHGESIDGTVLHTPQGGSDFWIKHFGSHNTWHSMRWEGNVKENRGFCHDTDSFYINLAWTLVLAGNRQSGINGEEYCEAYNMGFVNTFGGVGLEITHYSRTHHCYCVQNEGNLQRYMTWFFAHGYCIDSWVEDCTYLGDNLGTAFEIFQADGGGFKRCYAVNGYFSSNFSGGDYLWEDCTALIDLNVTPAIRPWMDSNAAVFNINVNIGGGAQTPEVILEGGRIVNPRIQIKQRTSDAALRTGIAINTGAVNMRISGTHPDKPGQGYINYIRSGAPSVYGEWAGISSNELTVIDGIRVEGLDNIVSNYGTIISHVGNRASDTPLVTNCVAEEIGIYDRATSSFSEGVGVAGNITNAEYEALP